MNDETATIEKRSPTQSGWLERLGQIFNHDVRTHEQLDDLLQAALKNNLLDQNSLNMIEGVLQVSEMQVRDIMIPRSQMVVVERDAELNEILPIVIDSAHSRFPVIGESKDEVSGILLAKDLLPQVNTDPNQIFSIRELLRPAVFIPESKRLNMLLNEFRASRNHMAIIVDEYGGIAGLVTIEDVLEQIVGEIEDEHDLGDDIYILEQETGISTLKAVTPIEDFNEHFHTELVSDEVDTMGGLVMNILGHMPKRGEAVQIDGFVFKVLRASSRRIHLLEARPLALAESRADVHTNTPEQVQQTNNSGSSGSAG